MIIDTIYKISQDIVNKYKQGYLSPDEFNRYFNLVQFQYFNYLIGLVENYLQGKPLAARGKMYDQTMQEKLAPFFKIAPTILNGSAELTKPSDFGSIIDLLSPSGLPCNPRAQNKLGNWLTDSIDVVSVSSPFAVDSGSFFQVYPLTGWTGTNTFVMNYYQLPPSALWAYAPDANGLPVYNPAASIQPLWNDNESSELIARVVALAGINLSNSQIIQFSQLQKQEG